MKKRPFPVLLCCAWRTILRCMVTTTTVLALAAASGLGQEDLEVGYGVLDPGQGTFGAAASALFKLTDPEGIVVTEAGVGAVRTLARGRIFVQQEAGISTGVALVNASGQSDTLQLRLRDSMGQVLAQTELALAPGEHRPRFVAELFPALPLAEVLGTLSFESERPDGELAAVTIRQGLNAFLEPLLTTLPVADLDAPSAAEGTLAFPQVGAGTGLSTQVVLFDRSSRPSQGMIRFFDSQGEPLVVQANGVAAAELAFQIASDGVFFAELTAADPNQLGVGYAVVTVQEGSLPEGSAIFRFFDGQGTTISEAGVGSVPATDRARILVDAVQTRTGVALANTSDATNSLQIDLLDPNGSALASSNREIPARGHLALFADEIFAIQEGFTGIMEIRAQIPLVPITLKLTSNQRNQSVLTTLPIADLSATELAARGAALPGSNRLILPQMGIGGSSAGDFSTRMILLSSLPNAPSGAELRFRTGPGQIWTSPRRPSDFPFAVGAGEMGSLLFSTSPLTPTLIPESESTRQITPAGGIIRLQDQEGNTVALTIPPFALNETTTVTMSLLEEPPRSTFLQNVYPGVRIQPEQLALNEPALLEIRLREAPPNLELSALFWLDERDQIRALGNQKVFENSIQGELNHFGIFTWERLTLSDAMFYAALILALEPEERALEGLPPVDPSELEALASIDDIRTLEELRRIRDRLADDSIADFPQLAELLEQSARRFLDLAVPDDPCGLYHAFLIEFADLARELGILGLDQAFQQRIDLVDQQCIDIDVTGTWLVESFEQSEACELLAGCQEGCEWEEEEEDEEVEAAVVQDGSSLTVTIPEVPQIGALMGRLQQSGAAIQPFFFTVEDQGPTTLDCLIFFETEGLGLDFGAPICSGENSCRPISCQETDTLTAGISPDGQSFIGLEVWDFTASVEETPPDGPARLFTYRCRGSAQVSGSKQDP